MRLEYRGPEVALHFLGLLLVALSLHQALGSPSATSRTRQQPPRPNVILISVDTLRADHLGTYGYDSPTSPRIDAFAKEGVVFENAMAPTPATLPSHTTLFTGLSPGTHGILTNRRRRAAPGLLTMAELLRSGGLRTASINDGAYLGRGFGLDQGFQFFDTIPDAVAETRTVATTLSDRAKKALAWLDASPPGEFFLFVHSYEVHIPLTPPDTGACPISSRPRIRRPDRRLHTSAAMVSMDQCDFRPRGRKTVDPDLRRCHPFCRRGTRRVPGRPA